VNEYSYSDIAQALKIIVEYSQGKGQLPRLDKFIIFWVGINSLCQLYNIDVKDIIDIDKLVKEYSVNSPMIEPPLWLKVIENMSKLNTKTEIITQLSKRKPLE
jgi:hypothetical protein